MSEIDEIIKRYKEVHHRLRHPPNAVPDTGINLVRGRAVPRLTTQSDQKEAPPMPPVERPVESAPVPPEPHKPTTLTFHSTLQLTAEAFGLTVEELCASSRKSCIVRPRQIAIYIASQYNRKSLAWIAKQLGIDHTTALYAVKRAKQVMDDNPSLKAIVEDIERTITSSYLPPVAAHHEPHLGAWKRWNVSQPVLSPMDQGG